MSFVLFVQLNAQKEYGISFGANSTYYSTNYILIFDDPFGYPNPPTDKIHFGFSSKIGVTISLQRHWSISDQFSVRISASFVQQKVGVIGDYSGVQGNLKGYIPGFAPSLNFTLHSIGLTPSLKYGISIGEVSPYLFIGPSVQYIYVYSMDYSPILDSKNNYSPAISKQIAFPHLSINLGFGVSTRIIGYTIFLEAEYGIGIRNLMKSNISSAGGYVAENFGNSNIDFNILNVSLGVAF
jgi:hypothetical protein